MSEGVGKGGGYGPAVFEGGGCVCALHEGAVPRAAFYGGVGGGVDVWAVGCGGILGH